MYLFLKKNCNFTKHGVYYFQISFLNNWNVFCLLPQIKHNLETEGELMLIKFVCLICITIYTLKYLKDLDKLLIINVMHCLHH